MDSSTSPQRPNKRQRARKACVPCRKRKRKCDGNYPCSMCTSYGYHCVFPPDEGPAAAYVDHPLPPEAEGKPIVANSNSVAEGSTDGENERPRSPEAVDRGILDPFKGRFMGLHSAVAFPRSLGLDLQSSNPPRIHSFAWNCGIRPEEPPPAHYCLSSIITREECERYSSIYFEAVHPVFGILDPKEFRQQTAAFWEAPTKGTEWSAVMSTVLALGSFFSAAEAHPNEHLLVAHGKLALEDPHLVRAPTLNLVTAHVLRTIYLRATTRPHAAWLASCVAVHCAEATGLHREIDRGVVLTSDQESPSDAPGKPRPQVRINGPHKSWGFGPQREGSEVTRRLFWCAFALNLMISSEYGRSCVILNGITTKLPQEKEGDFTYWYIRLARIIPSTQHTPNQFGFTPATSGVSNTADILLKALSRIDEIPNSHPYLTLSKVDLALGIFRRLRLLSPFSSASQFALANRIVALGTAGLAAALELTKRHHFWWQALCTPFQYICVLLAIDNSRSLREIKPAMSTLEKVSTTLGTHVSGEAVTTAKLLVRDSRRKKKREMDLLDEIAGIEDAEREEQVRDAGLTPMAHGSAGSKWDGGEGFGWSWDGGGDVDWNALLDPGFGFLPPDYGGGY